MIQVTVDFLADFTTVTIDMGRPKSEEARHAAMAATVDLVLAHGVAGVTFEDVAARSGVAKTTLYRHFGSKAEMIVESAGSCFHEVPTPDTGDLARDLREILDRSHKTDDEYRVPDMIPALIAASDRDPDLHALLVAMLEERRRPIRTVLQLAQLRGEISPDLDLDTALAMLLGPITQRRIVDRVQITQEFAYTVIDLVVAALRSQVLPSAG